MTRRAAAGALLLLAVAAPVEAQHLGSSSVTAGVQSLSYRFGPHFGVRSLSQWAIPGAVVLARGRWLADLGASLASTTLTRQDGSALTVTGLTDTQLRAARVFGEDALVATLAVNLPTGPARLTAPEYAVLAAASSSFLGFPVSAYGSGVSVTAGGAAATSAGAWNLGLAASLRYNGEFTPFEDADGDFSYQAGIEGRVRGGVDRLVGPARVSLGLTYSTFSNDEFSSGAGSSGIYRPGTRFILEGSYATTIRTTTVLIYAWDFLRLAGDSAGTDAANRENVFAGGLRLGIPLSRSVVWEPGAEGRLSFPEEGRGALGSAVSALRIRVSRRLSAIPELRLVIGRLEEPPPSGVGHQITGFGFSVLFRESF